MTDSNLVLSQPEGELEGMVAPGQESILDEFVAEQEQEEQQKLLGKFNSPEELAKAYQELERKLGQSGTSDPAGTEGAAQSTGYTAEQAAQLYGKEAVELLAGKGLDLADVMWQADNGQDISQHYDTLAAAFKVPRQVVENYVAKAQSPAAAQSSGLTEQDSAALKAMVGGEESFQQLSQWAVQNLDPAELAQYNAVVDGGNKDAIGWALKAIQARAASAPTAEPKLISGGRPPAVEKFESKQQVLDAMNKRNEKGQKLYEVDEAYRAKFMQILDRSEVFV